MFISVVCPSSSPPPQRNTCTPTHRKALAILGRKLQKQNKQTKKNKNKTRTVVGNRRVYIKKEKKKKRKYIYALICIIDV